MLAHTKISQSAQYFKDKPALIVDGKPISYGMLDNAIVNSAEWLAGAGVKPAMVVALSLSDAVLQLYLTLALLRLGAIQATLNPRLQSSISRDLASRLGIQLMITDTQPKQTEGFRNVASAGTRHAGKIISDLTHRHSIRTRTVSPFFVMALGPPASRKFLL